MAQIQARADIPAIIDLITGKGKKRNQALSDVILESIRLGLTPENIEFPAQPPQQAAESQFGQGMAPSNIVQQILSGQLGTARQEQNPAYQDLIQKILQGSEQFARLGGDPNQLVGVLGKTGVLQDPIAKRQSELEGQRQKNRMEQEKFKQGQINQRAKEKNIITGRLANSLISYRQGATPQQAKNVLLDLNQQLRLELNDYYDTVKDFPMIQATAMASGFPAPPPPVMPTLEDVAGRSGYDLKELQRQVGGGKKTGPPPSPYKSKADVVNALKAGRITYDEAESILEKQFKVSRKAKK